MATRIVPEQIRGVPAPGSNDVGKALVYTGGNSYAWVADEVPIPVVRGISIPQPRVNDNITLFYASTPMVLSRIKAHVLGTNPSVSFSLRFGANRNTVGAQIVSGGMICNNTGPGNDYTDLSLTTIPVDNWVWLTVSEISGTVSLFHLTLIFAA
jgi:hypothetical protein